MDKADRSLVSGGGLFGFEAVRRGLGFGFWFRVYRVQGLVPWVLGKGSGFSFFFAI